MLLAALAGVPAGYLLGGRLRNVGRLRLDHLWLLWIAAAALVASRLLESRIGVGRNPAPLATGLLAAFVLVNTIRPARWLRIGMAAIALGWALNGAVILANGGMPVAAAVLEHHPSRLERLLDLHGSEHTVLSPSTRLRPLADILPVPCLHRLWRNDHRIRCGGLSLGDVLLAVGIAMILAHAMTDRSGSDGEQLLDCRPRGDPEVVPPFEELNGDVIGRREAAKCPGDELGGRLG